MYVIWCRVESVWT